MTGTRRAGPLGLVPPFASGETVSEGWRLLRVERRAGARWALQIGPPELAVIVERKREGNQYAAESEHFGLWVEAPAEAPPGLLAALAARLREPADPDLLLDIARPAAEDSAPTLYLVPGHIGDPFDLSVRAVHVASSAGLVLVEAGGVESARRSLATLGVEGVAIAEGSLEALESALAAGHDVCLFGGDEGIPGFCDPGKESFAGLDVRVRVVGGPSVLGMALMRVPLEVREFLFLGLLQGGTDAMRIRRRIDSVPGCPVVLFSTGAVLRARLPGLIRKRRGTVHLVANLTRPGEYALAFAMGAQALPERVADDDAVVAFLAFESRARRLWNFLAPR